MRIRISDSAFVPKKHKEPKNRLFQRGNFEFWINGNNHDVMTFHNCTRKFATERAIKSMPECTFTVIQVG